MRQPVEKLLAGLLFSLGPSKIRNRHRIRMRSCFFSQVYFGLLAAFSTSWRVTIGQQLSEGRSSSSRRQNLKVQVQKLNHCDKISQGQRSMTGKRPRLDACLE
jgi:hypothetical protein